MCPIMAVTQKSDGRWACTYYVDKKMKWKYFGRGAQAEKAARDFDAELKAAGQVRPYKKRSKTFGPTFSELFEAYLKSKAATLPETSIKNQVTLPGHYRIEFAINECFLRIKLWCYADERLHTTLKQ